MVFPTLKLLKGEKDEKYMLKSLNVTSLKVVGFVLAVRKGVKKFHS